MPINRKDLKSAAKATIRASVPSALLVTLVYALLTSGVEFLRSSFFPGPLDSYRQLMSQMIASGNVDADSMERLLLAAFTGPFLAVTLFVSIAMVLYTMVMQYGYYRYALLRVRGFQAGYGNLFDAFSLAGKVILTEIIMNVFIFLWSLLFFFPGIIAAYRYRQAPYILLDEPDISPMEAIRRSKAMMAGHKAELFVLDLSFIGWYFLASFAGAIVMTPLAAVNDVAGAFANLAVTTVFYLWINPYTAFTFANYYDALNGNFAAPTGEAGPADRQPPAGDAPSGGQDVWEQ